MHLLHRADVGHELGQRVATQRDDDLGRDGGDLCAQERVTSRYLLLLGIAIARWPMFDDVRYEHVASAEAGGLQELIEELTRRTDERPSLLVFVKARCLAHEHD